MNDKITSFPRIVHAVPDPLALYLRPGQNDHRALLNLMASGIRSFGGAVLDPTKIDRHAELKDQILNANMDAILDPRTLKSATAGGYTKAMANLPWGCDRPHEPSDFEGMAGRRLLSEIAAFACHNGYTEVLAPTHCITGVNDAWLPIDLESTRLLRTYLDNYGGANIPLIYPLAITYKLLRSPGERRLLIRELQGLPVDSIWLTVSGVGRNSGAAPVRNYIEASRDFHSLKLPLVADHMGGAFGLSLMAFGAVGGMSHGFMQNETFDMNRLKVAPKTKGYGKARKIYVPAIDAMLSEKEAEILLESKRVRTSFVCNDSDCCPRGMKDMIQNNMRHFLFQRVHEVARLSKIPETLRPQRFLDQHLRPATDKAVMAHSRVDWNDEKLEAKMLRNRKHLDALRIALGHEAETNPPRSFAKHPKTRAARSAAK